MKRQSGLRERGQTETQAEKFQVGISHEDLRNILCSDLTSKKVDPDTNLINSAKLTEARGSVPFATKSSIKVHRKRFDAELIAQWKITKDHRTHHLRGDFAQACAHLREGQSQSRAVFVFVFVFARAVHALSLLLSSHRSSLSQP